MDQFPVLVEHGPLIWRVFQIGLCAAVLAAIGGIRWWMARGARLAEQQRLRIDHGAIRGVLRGGGATTVTASSVDQTFGDASWRAESLRLDTGDRVIELAGPIKVIAGTRFAGRRGGLPKLSDAEEAAVREALPWTATRTRNALAVHLSEGDEIEVRGMPEPSAGQGETTSREADIAWSMRGEHGPLRLAAIEPVVARLPLGWVRTALVVLGTAGASTLALRSCADRWVLECNHLAHHDGETFVELDNTHACVLAASTPKRRDDGLDELLEYLEDEPYRDDRAVARIDALAREVVGCDKLPASLLEAKRYDAAIAEARRCGDRRTEHEALVGQGYFEQAAAISVPASDRAPALPRLTTLVAASRWREAAAVVRSGRIDEGSYRGYDDCLADWFEQLAGDAEAATRMASDRCAALRKNIDPSLQSSSFAVWLHEPEEILVRPESSFDALELWLPIHERPGSRANRALRLRQQAVRTLLDNDVEGALAIAREVEALSRELLETADHDDYAFVLRAPSVLVPAIQLYTPTIFNDIGRRFADTEERIAAASKRITSDDDPRSKQSAHEYNVVRYPRLFERSSEDLGTRRFDEVATAARDGKPERVMELVQTRRYGSPNYMDLLAVLPYIPSLHARLARELPHTAFGRSWTRGPAGAALDAFARRELFEAIGATAAAAQWDAIYRRHAAMLRDPTHALALHAF